LYSVPDLVALSRALLHTLSSVFSQFGLRGCGIGARFPYYLCARLTYLVSANSKKRAVHLTHGSGSQYIKINEKIARDVGWVYLRMGRS
jgi:hypothetical protein